MLKANREACGNLKSVRLLFLGFHRQKCDQSSRKTQKPEDMAISISTTSTLKVQLCIAVTLEIIWVLPHKPAENSEINISFHPKQGPFDKVTNSLACTKWTEVCILNEKKGENKEKKNLLVNEGIFLIFLTELQFSTEIPWQVCIWTCHLILSSGTTCFKGWGERKIAQGKLSKEYP